MFDDLEPDAGRPAAPLRAALRQLLEKAQALEPSLRHLIPAVWAEVVGPWYAKHSYVTRVWEGIVEVCCDSAARAQQLQLDAPKIIRRLNERIGQEWVREIRPSSAEGLRPPASRARPDELPAPSEEELDAIELTERERQWIAQQAAAVRDEAARASFVRSLETYLKFRRWKLDHGWIECPRCGEIYHPREGCWRCRAETPHGEV